jgi:hypothetical protein
LNHFSRLPIRYALSLLLSYPKLRSTSMNIFLLTHILLRIFVWFYRMTCWGAL